MKIERQIEKGPETEKKKNTLEGVVCSPVGSHNQPVFKRVYVKEIDRAIVKQVDTFDLYEFIQASKAQTDLAILYKRYVELGEIPSVDPNMTSADFTSMPDNIHEVYNMVNDISGNFAKLPASIQAIFGTKEAYLKSLMDGTYQATLINALNAVKPQAAKEDVAESEGN